MANETKIFTGMAETTTGNVQTSSFRDNSGDDEPGNERSEDQQSAAIKKAKQHSQAACYFQPGQIKRQPHRQRPWEQMVVIDIDGKANRIDGFDDASVNENTADNQSEDAAKDIAPQKVHRSRATPNK